MNLSELKNIGFAVGYGKDDFSMKRGSFNYKRSLKWKNDCTLSKTEERAGGFLLEFSEKKSERIHRLSVTEEDSGIISVDYEGKLPAEINRVFITLPAFSEERIYGCGENYSKLNLKGEKVRIFVAEHQNANRIAKKLIREKLFGVKPDKVLPFSKYESYYVQPTYVSSKRYFVHATSKRYSEFDFSSQDTTVLSFEEMPSLKVGSAATFSELSEKLTRLVGRQKALPDWIYDGAVLAVQEGCAVIDEKIKRAEAKGVKVCGIWSQDWCGCRRTGFGYQVMWNWEADNDLYPNLPEKIKEWKAKGIRFLGYINPFIALEKDLYREAAAKGYCVKDKNGNDYLVTITTFPAAMVDFTNPEAYRWYKDIIKNNMIGIGMGGWMADFGEYLPVDSVLHSGEDPMDLHNRWPCLWAKLNREAIEECKKTDEIFFFTRAGYTDTNRFSTMMWTGDQHVDWSLDDGIPSVIPASLSLSMSGYGISHSDAGGYTTVMHMTREKELLMRWEEMNTFSPLLRTHEGNQPSRNVQFDSDDELLHSMTLASRRHAALKNYLKDCVIEEAEKGTPVIRPLFYHYDEEAAYDEKTEYMLGRDMLVAPVLKKGEAGREVYLPDDEWTDLFSGEKIKPGKHFVKAPLGQIPVYIRNASKRYKELMDIGKII